MAIDSKKAMRPTEIKSLLSLLVSFKSQRICHIDAI